MGATTEEVQTLIHEVMTKQDVNNYNLNISGSSSKGDGYLGDLIFVEIQAVKHNEQKIFNLAIKFATASDKLRKIFPPITEIYIREILLYDELFPAIEDLKKEYAIKDVTANYAKCYGVRKLYMKEALVLENLKSIGYELHASTIPQNFEHALLAFQTYAKFHGGSIALKIKRPEIFRNITKNMTDIMGIFVTESDVIVSFKKCYEKGIEILKKNGKADAAEKIIKAIENFDEKLTKMTISDDLEAENEAVILHGDCWNNNMMFKYNGIDKSAPLDMVFLDFQLSRVASPIVDLTDYLYTSADKSTLDKLNYLLEEYHKTLTKYLQQFNINCDEILTLNRLKSSWRKYGKFGLAKCGLLIRMELAEKDELINFLELIEAGTMADYTFPELKLEEEYEKRMFDVFYHFSEKFCG